MVVASGTTGLSPFAGRAIGSLLRACESRSNGKRRAAFSAVISTSLPKKRAFFWAFLRFFLAFCDYLGYSPLRPEFFR